MVSDIEQSSKTKLWLDRRRSVSLMLPAEVMQSGTGGESETSEKEMLRIKVPGCRMISILGHGGMGTVFLARQENLDRLVAVKMLNRDLTGQPEFTARLLREAQIMGKFSHPNLVNCHDVICNDDGVFVIMEYIPGHFSGRDVVRQFGAVPEVYVVQIMLSVCKALEYIHEKGFLHLDMKPDNLLMQYDSTRPLMNVAELFEHPDNRVAVCDFGIALRAFEISSQVNSSVMGSPYYMAPEQVLSPDAVDFRADMYAMGVTAWFFLAGKDPYSALTEEAMLEQKIRENFCDSNPLPSDISSGLKRVMYRLGSVKPEERYDDYSVLIHDLNAVQQELEHLRHRPARIMRDIRKNIAYILVYGLVIGLLALAGIGIYIQYASECYRRTVEESSPFVKWSGDTNGWSRIMDEESYHPVFRAVPGAGRLQYRDTARPGQMMTWRIRLRFGGAVNLSLGLLDNGENQPPLEFGRISCTFGQGGHDVGVRAVSWTDGGHAHLTRIPGPSRELLADDDGLWNANGDGEWIKLDIQVLERQCRIWEDGNLLGVIHFPKRVSTPEVCMAIESVSSSIVDLFDVMISNSVQ